MKKFSTNLLKTLNLSESQVAVYLASLELGQASMQDLAKKSNVKRTSIYNFIEELKTRGLITEIKKGKRKVYSAVDPRQVIEAEKLRLQEFEHALPELLAIQNKSQTKPRVTFYEGIENVLSVYDDQIKDKQTIHAFEDIEYMKLAMPEHFYYDWPALRARNNIAFRSITRDSEAAREYTKKNIRLLRETKILKTEKPWKSEINIYGDKVAFFRFREDHAMVVLVEDKDIAYTLLTAWKELWSRLEVPKIG